MTLRCATGSTAYGSVSAGNVLAYTNEFRRQLEASSSSAGIKNPSIHDALVELLGKQTAECDALCIPTALYGHPWAGPRQAWRCISGQETGTPTVGLGWKSMGVLELTALPSLDAERWVPLVRETDVLLVEGGDATYLCHWMRQSGLAAS